MDKPKDPSLIPPGRYCYRWVDVAPCEVVPEAGPEFGRLQRESMGYHPSIKQVLCPYVERSGYGTVRCLFLQREAVVFGNDREDLIPKLMNRFGTPDAFDWFEEDSLLGDYIKVCGFGGPDEEGDSEDDPTGGGSDEVGDTTAFAFLKLLWPGDWVEHQELGKGFVVDIDFPAEGGPQVWVDFGLRGRQQLALRVALLRRIAPLSAQAEKVWREAG